MNAQTVTPQELEAARIKVQAVPLSYRAAQFGCSVDALIRHARTCIADDRARIARARSNGQQLGCRRPVAEYEALIDRNEFDLETAISAHEASL